MQCSYCGKELNPNSKFCTGCGAPAPAQPQQPVYTQPQQPVYTQPQQPVYTQPQQPVYQQPVYAQPYTPVPQDLTWGQFYKQYVAKGSRGYTTWMAVICFFTALVSIGIGAVMEESLFIMDVAVYLSMGILLLATKHWLFALLPTIYSGIFTVIGMANGGTPSGIVALVVGVKCVMVLSKAQKAYKKYRLEGIVPEKPI